MDNRNLESLADYVRRQVREKNLSHKAVEWASGNRISSQYVADIISGTATNLTIGKVQALARGLGVSEDEMFIVARGRRPAPPQLLEDRVKSIAILSSELNQEDLNWWSETLEMVERELRHRISKDGNQRASAAGDNI